MTKFEKIEQLYLGHNCNNCKTFCEKRNGICEKWTEDAQFLPIFSDHPPINPKIGDATYSVETSDIKIYNGKTWLILK